MFDHFKGPCRFRRYSKEIHKYQELNYILRFTEKHSFYKKIKNTTKKTTTICVSPRISKRQRRVLCHSKGVPEWIRTSFNLHLPIKTYYCHSTHNGSSFSVHTRGSVDNMLIDPWTPSTFQREMFNFCQLVLKQTLSFRRSVEELCGTKYIRAALSNFLQQCVYVLAFKNKRSDLGSCSTCFRRFRC